jgi:hypothetical protein
LPLTVNTTCERAAAPVSSGWRGGPAESAALRAAEWGALRTRHLDCGRLLDGGVLVDGEVALAARDAAADLGQCVVHLVGDVILERIR